MRIAEVQLTSADVGAAAAFYREVLDLPVELDALSATVQVGPSRLVLAAGDSGPGSHHVAVTVPSDRFDAAKQWLGKRAPLLTRAGSDEFALPEPWNSQSVYFTGPDAILLELIARHSLPAASRGVFSSADLLCVSEIGIAVADADTAVDRLSATFGLRRFGTGDRQFRPVGGHDGLLIVVARDRIWFPTPDTPPSGRPLTVTLEVAGKGDALAVTPACTVRSR